jgi:hypothetical protein
VGPRPREEKILDLTSTRTPTPRLYSPWPVTIPTALSRLLTLNRGVGVRVLVRSRIFSSRDLGPTWLPIQRVLLLLLLVIVVVVVVVVVVINKWTVLTVTCKQWRLLNTCFGIDNLLWQVRRAATVRTKSGLAHHQGWSCNFQTTCSLGAQRHSTTIMQTLILTYCSLHNDKLIRIAAFKVNEVTESDMNLVRSLHFNISERRPPVPTRAEKVKARLGSVWHTQI